VHELRRQDEPELMAMCADTGVGLVPYSPQGKGRLARPWGEQSTRSTVDHVVQAFDSPLDEPVVTAVQQLAHVDRCRRTAPLSAPSRGLVPPVRILRLAEMLSRR
jgi:aryl-alcohol dehydrogenase-like predicted oxidoreductase